MFLDSILKCRKHWIEIHTECDSVYKCTLSFYNHAKKPSNEIYESHTPLQAKCTVVRKKYKNRESGLMPIWRKQFRNQEANRRRSLFAGIEIILVRDKTNSRDQVVFAHEKETVIVAKKISEPKSKENVIRIRNSNFS